MGKSKDFIESIDNKLSISRRGFVKGAAALSAGSRCITPVRILKNGKIIF